MRSRFTLVTPDEPDEPDEYGAPNLESAPFSVSSRSLPGSDRIGFIAVLFMLNGFAWAIAACLVLWGLLGFSQISTTPAYANPWQLALLCPGASWASFRTSRLLKARKREGAWLAAGNCVVSIVTAYASGHTGLSGAFSGVVGLALVGSIWQYLE
jgi:hypothetical protein